MSCDVGEVTESLENEQSSFLYPDSGFVSRCTKEKHCVIIYRQNCTKINIFVFFKMYKNLYTV